MERNDTCADDAYRLRDSGENHYTFVRRARTAPPTDPYVHITLRRPSFSSGRCRTVACGATCSL